ncbi:MAG: hypothetical protein HQK53_19065 [Oligoflexia bacterium]|nr:hypothetical protein [Oligoflexia bacterium]
MKSKNAVIILILLVGIIVWNFLNSEKYGIHFRTGVGSGDNRHHFNRVANTNTLIPIKIGSRMVHSNYGQDCLKCHSIIGSDNEPARPAPPLAANATLIHPFRGVCTKCHTITPASGAQQVANTNGVGIPIKIGALVTHTNYGQDCLKCHSIVGGDGKSAIPADPISPNDLLVHPFWGACTKCHPITTGKIALAGNLQQQQLHHQQFAGGGGGQGQGQLQAQQIQTIDQVTGLQGQGQSISGGQYVCSQCGHTGLPHFDQSGTPHCSECGGVMKMIN